MPRVVIAPALARWLTAAPSNGAREVAAVVEGATVRDCLNGLFEKFPTLRGYVLDEAGTMRHHVVAFVDGAAISDKRTLDMPVPANGELFLFQALSGG